MPILATGTQLSNNISFNSGTLDINGVEVAAIDDITITLAFSQKELYALGSIIQVVAPKRHGFKPSAKFKVKSMNKELYGFFLGSSSPDGSGSDYTVLDGQNVLTRASIKCIINDVSTQIVEFQFSNAILAGNLQAALKTENHAEVDFEIYAQNVTIVNNGSF